MSDAQRLAHAFARVLRSWLDAEEIATVIERNRAQPPGSGICHSHDFCDANMAMDEAFGACGFWRWVDDGEDVIFVNDELWAEAWGLAKQSEFATS